MELRSIRGGNISDLEAKKYTIGVGISLGNKWFTPENIAEAIQWSLRYSKDKVVVYIADTIHGINISVRSRISLEKATKEAVAAGVKLFDQVKAKLADFPKDQADKIVFVTWDEIVDDKFKEKLVYLNDLYDKEGEFRETIHSLVRAHVSKEKRNFSDEDIHDFGRYIVAEMPEFQMRVPMKGIIVDAYTYPTDNSLTAFADKLQKGEVFPEIKERIMDTEPKVFLELR